MEKQIITFSAEGQVLTKTDDTYLFASNIVSYIDAEFDLSDTWTGFDAVTAVWSSATDTISVVLDGEGTCEVPAEILRYPSKIVVNLVGSDTEAGVLVDRLTTYPVVAFTIDRSVKLSGTETPEVTPSQFEQYVGIVRGYYDDIHDYSDDSEAWAVGERRGVAVDSDDETYHNNAKYYADAAAQDLAQIESEIDESVDEYLTAHPELTTTVVDDSLTTVKYKNSSVTTAKIADANVTTAKLADGSVTTAKIADGAVTKAKLASAVQTKIDLIDTNASDITAIEGAATALTTRVGTAEGDIDALDARITNLATLTNGSTTGDAELIDARVVGSTTYASLHQAIDTEFSDVKADFNLLNDSMDFIADGALVNKYNIPLGTTNTKTLLSSIYLKAGVYTLTYTQEQTLTSNTRNTPWWSTTGGTKVYMSNASNYRLTAGTYDWAITIPSDGYYDFGLWVHTPNIAVDYTMFYVHKESVKAQITALNDDVDTLDRYTKGIYQDVNITGSASTNIIKPFYVKTGDSIEVTNNGTAIISAYTCSEDGTAIDTISSSIGVGATATKTATANANFIKVWSSAAVNAQCKNTNSVIDELMDKDNAMDEMLKLVQNNISVQATQSGNLYIPYDFKIGHEYVITNNSSVTCSLATCDASNTAIQVINTGLASGKSFEFTASANAVKLRVWSSTTEKNVTLVSNDGLEYNNNHNVNGPYIPDYYYSYLPSKLETIRSLGSEVCTNGEQFIFLTDYHDYKNAKQSPALVKYLFDHTGVKFIVFGGDNINLGLGYDDVFEEIAKFFGDFNFLDRNQMIVVTGNHEHYSNVNAGYEEEDVPTEQDLYYSLMNQRSLWEVDVDEYGDYILANPLSKIYYCVFNCDYYAEISDDQVNAVADMVMSLNDGWHIMFIAHRLLMGDASVIANTNLTDMADAIASKSSVTVDGVTHNFSTKNIDVLPLLSGHTHQDGMVQTTGGIPVIATTTDAIDLDLINTRTKGTTNEQAFDVISLDMTNRIIYLTRIGAGSDRQYSY